MPASSRRVVWLPAGLGIALACASAAPRLLASAAPAAGPSPTPVVINVRDFGATGDGRLHRLTEWIANGRFRSLRAIQQKYPFVDNLDWTLDELAFTLAKQALPDEGGTIHFPAGHYVTGRHSWRIWRNHVRLTGEGADRTILSTAPEIEDALSLAPYRHVGWLEGADREYPFSSDSGRRGESSVRLQPAEAAREFRPGELIFIRNGANRFDQDYGEFNEVAAIDADGSLRLRHPLGRDYTEARINWAGEIAEDFTLPRRGGAVRVTLREGKGYFLPRGGASVSIAGNLFRVEKPSGATVRLVNQGRANQPRGTVIPAGSKVSKSRAVLKLTRSTRDFRCERLQLIGRRKVVSISNSYDVAFSDCTFLRDLRDGGFKGGLVLDGDGGRFARFQRCTFIATPAIGMQMARSFGGIVFEDCTFKDTNVAFTEFNFDGEVVRCTFDVRGTPALTNVIIVGKSCGDLRVVGNRIKASKVPFVFDTVSDIHSQKHGSEGDVVIRGNTIEAENVGRVFPLPKSHRLVLEDNQVIGK